MVTKLAEEWARSRSDQNELGVQTMLSASLRNGITGEMDNLILRQMDHAIAKKCLTDGTSPRSAIIEEERDASRRAWEYTLRVQTEKTPTLAGFSMDLIEELAEAKRILRFPWWKLAWWRIRGRPISGYPWQLIE